MFTLVNHVRYDLLCWGKTKRGKISDINTVVNRALQILVLELCVSSTNLAKKILGVKGIKISDILKLSFLKVNNNILSLKVKFIMSYKLL